MSIWNAATKSEIDGDFEAILAKMRAIEPTPDVNPLQAQLDAAIAERNAALGALTTMTGQRDALQSLLTAGRAAAAATVQALAAAE